MRLEMGVGGGGGRAGQLAGLVLQRVPLLNLVARCCVTAFHGNRLIKTKWNRMRVIVITSGTAVYFNAL